MVGFTMDDKEYDLSPPPENIIETLRSLGYTPPTAIADLIDNSVTAGATKIDVLWSGTEQLKNL